MADRDQIVLIHTLKSALKLSDDIYRARVMGFSGGFDGSSLALTYDQARQLIDELKTEAIFKGVWKTTPAPPNQGGEPVARKYDNLAGRKGFASPAQLRMIEAMWKQCSFTHDAGARESALRKFIFRITHKSAMEFIEGRDVSKLVNAMKSMKHNSPLKKGDKEGC